jgi:hypothetical protein
MGVWSWISSSSYQDLEVTTEELAALRAQLATVALMLADVGQPHPLRG